MRMQFLINFAIGAATGIITGFGIGGGTLLVLYLTLFGGYSQLEAQGINLVYFIPCAVLALVSHIKNKKIDVSAALYTGGFGAGAALLAAFIAARMDVGKLSRFFGAFLILIGITEAIAIYKDRKNKKNRHFR